LQKPVTIEGPGLFTGRPATLQLRPAAGGAGIAFACGESTVAADIRHLEKQPRHTVLRDGDLRVETVEHLLAALAAAGVSDVEIEFQETDEGDGVQSVEVPMADGSSMPFLAALAEAGFAAAHGGADVEPLVVTKPTQVEAEADSDASLVALPGPKDALEIVYTFEAPAPVGRQVAALRIDWTDTPDDPRQTRFGREVADARTFIFEAEAEALRSKGWGGHLTTRDLLVIGTDGPIDNTFRHDDEPVRHKVLDLVGDLALLGRPVCGRIVAHKSGHALNHQLSRALLDAEDDRGAGRGVADEIDPADPIAAGFRHLLGKSAAEAALDVRRIQRLLPHRFPMLLVDRVLEFDGDRRAVGVKNVTMGDVFFLGHYPQQPIFPGVLIVEAMGQLGGILLSRKLEHTGKIAILLSMDGVKMRHPVTPGDQLVLVAEAVRVRSRTGQVRCRAYVQETLAAEADIKFMLTDAEPA
jgi:UDP-3-O-[3-hydroxymyristoyl] N-acetylglucosamine deacetylase/3-hydroxyacyl-[acyl-carrier-protein] dehydratase